MNPAQRGPPGVLPYLLLILSTASWGGNRVASRTIYQEVTLFALVFWRWTLAALIILPFVLPHLRRDLPAALTRWRWIVFFGLAGPAAFAILGYLGIRYCWNHAVPLVGPNVATFFYPVAPVFASLAALVILDEQLQAYHLAGSALVLAGLYLSAERR